MLRFSAALALTLLTGVAVAQTTASTPAAPKVETPPDPAVVNVRLAAPLPADQAAVKAHVLFLASDALRGREAGTPEYDIAAQYVAAQFYAAGLRPGGDADNAGGSYLQRVPLVTYRLEGTGSFAWTPDNARRRDVPTAMAVGGDFTATANPARAVTRISAPVVFLGWGLDAARFGHDNYKGVDVRGKIVAVVNGAPVGLGGEERAFFQSAATKAEIAARHGAVGLIVVTTRPAAPLSVNGTPRPAGTATVGRMTWAKADGTGRDGTGVPILGTLTAAGAAKLWGRDWIRITTAAMAGNAARYPTLRAPGTLTVESRTSFMPAASSNVVGVIPGSDPRVKDEVVVLSAHLDHIGVRTTGEGDRINNGALDNAIGIASLIEEAKRFAASGRPPRRTVMFLAVTAEEKGLVGADYFANHPTVPLRSIVANINLDMPLLTYRFEDMIVYGADRSTLGPIVQRAMAAVGVTQSPDPAPEQGIFVRSDHFRFVQKGIPSVFLWPGQKGPGAAAFAAFMGRCYHRPCDELAQQPIMWDQAVRFVDVNYRIAREVADGAARPVWNRGDYFGQLYRGPMARAETRR